MSASTLLVWPMQVLTSKVPCSGNGEVQLPFGHRNYLGLGSVVFFTLIVTDIFGSPFLRNCQVLAIHDVNKENFGSRRDFLSTIIQVG